MRKKLSLLLLLFLIPTMCYAWGVCFYAGETVTSTGPGKTDMIAWFDFADATDAHASFDWTVNEGAPGYTAGSPNYLTTTESANLDSSGNSLDESVCASDVDQSYGIRFYIDSGNATNGDYIFTGNSDRNKIRYLTSGFLVELMDVVETTGDVWTTDNWHTCIVSFDAATDTITTWQDGEGTPQTEAGTAQAGSGGTIQLSRAANTGLTVRVDWMGFWSKELTQSNIEWLHNSGSTRIYADF